MLIMLISEFLIEFTLRQPNFIMTLEWFTLHNVAGTIVSQPAHTVLVVPMNCLFASFNIVSGSVYIMKH